MRRQSETLLLVPLLPVFLLGMFPMLLIGLLGFFGLIIFGILLICVGLTLGLEAHGEFNEEIIVHGYTRGSERATQASRLHAATLSAVVLEGAGLALVAAGAGSLCWFG